MALGFSSALGHSGAELARGLVVVGYDDSAVDRGLARTEGTLHKSSGLFTKLGLGIGVVGVAAAAMGLKFEHSLKRTQALVGVSAKQMDEYKESILDLSVETGKSTDELADALYFIASSGLSGQAALDALTASAKASAAGLGETMVIADAVTSAVNAYGQANLSAASATDILLSAVRVGKNEPEELSRAIGSSIGLAQKMGVEFSEVASTIATYSLAGNSARMATFGLNAILTTFLKPTKMTADALDKLGTNAEEVADSISQDGLQKTLMDLVNSVDGDRVALAKLFPNVRALRLVLGLTGETAGVAAKNLDAVKNSAGETDKAFNIVAQDTQAKLHKAFNALIAIITRLGLLITPIIGPIADVFLALAHAIDNNMGVVSALAKVLGIATAAWLAYKGVLVTVAIWQAIRMPLAIAATVASMVIQQGVMATLTAAWVALDAVMTANPIGAVIVALTLLVVGLVYAYKHSETFRRIVAAAFKYAADAAALALKIITFQIRLFLKGLGYLAEAASHLPIIGDKFKGVKEQIDKVVDALDQAIDFVDELGEKDPVVVDVTLQYRTTFAPFSGEDPLHPTPGKTPKRKPQFGDPDWKPSPGVSAPSGGAAGTRTFEIPAVLAMRRVEAHTDAETIAAIQAELSFLNWVKRTRDLTAKELLSVSQDIRSRQDEIEGIRTQATKDAQDNHDKAVQDAKDALDEAVKLPERIAQGQARAEQLGKKTPILHWARAEVIFLQKLINSHKYHGERLTDLYTRLGAAKKKVSDARKMGLKDAASKDEAPDLPDEIELGKAMARATLTNKADDLKWAKRELAWIQRQINSHKFHGKALIALYNDLADAKQTVIDAREAANKKAEEQNRKNMSAQQQWAFLNTRTQFFDQFGSNVFRMGSAGAAATPDAALSSIQAPQASTIVNVNQTFPAPTTDMHREARYARAATKAVFD